MPTLLHIDSSPRSASVSSELARKFVARWKRRHRTGAVIHHNTSHERFPYLDEAAIEAFFKLPVELSEDQLQFMEISDRLADELVAADVVVLSAPMWNLGIPVSLKAWIDLIVREGRTFEFGEHGVRGLLEGKKAYVFSACGGAYSEGIASKRLDLQEPYLRAILAALGLTEMEFIRAENQSRGLEPAREGVMLAAAAMAELIV